MIRNEYVAGEPYDRMFPRIILDTKKHIKENNDDGLFLYTGVTGAGKSTLMEHSMSAYSMCPDAKDICITQESFAIRQYENTIRGLNGEKDVQLAYDEASITKKRHAEKYVKDVVDLYMINRAAGIMHHWCWPNLKGIHNDFINERVKGVFFIYTKQKFKPRRYVFYPKDHLMKMLELGISLNSFNLKKHRKKYGYFIGCFTKYDGSLQEGYLKNKTDSILEISKSFADKYSGKKEKSVGGNSASVKDSDDVSRVVGALAVRTYIQQKYNDNFTLNQIKSCLDRKFKSYKCQVGQIPSIVDDLRARYITNTYAPPLPINNRAKDEILTDEVKE